MRFIAFFVVYFGMHTLAHGQFLRTELANFPLPDTAQAQQLRLHIDLKHFFKNNEYFNDYAPGYT